jgi:hypothetical protein
MVYTRSLVLGEGIRGKGSILLGKEREEESERQKRQILNNSIHLGDPRISGYLGTS